MTGIQALICQYRSYYRQRAGCYGNWSFEVEKSGSGNTRWWQIIGGCVTALALCAGFVHITRHPASVVDHQQPDKTTNGGTSNTQVKSDAEIAEEENQARREKEANAAANLEHWKHDMDDFQKRTDGDRDVIANSLPVAQQYAAQSIDPKLTREERGNAQIGLNDARHRVLDALADLTDAQRHIRDFRSVHPELPADSFTRMLAPLPVVTFTHTGNVDPPASAPTQP